MCKSDGLVAHNTLISNEKHVFANHCISFCKRAKLQLRLFVKTTLIKYNRE